MYTGQLIFSQVMDHLPMHTFRRCVKRYHGNHGIKSFTCLDQFLCMAFAQLTYRESLRDIEACLRTQQNKLYHMGAVKYNGVPWQMPRSHGTGPPVFTAAYRPVSP